MHQLVLLVLDGHWGVAGVLCVYVLLYMCAMCMYVPITTVGDRLVLGQCTSVTLSVAGL